MYHVAVTFPDGSGVVSFRTKDASEAFIADVMADSPEAVLEYVDAVRARSLIHD